MPRDTHSAKITARFAVGLLSFISPAISHTALQGLSMLDACRTSSVAPVGSTVAALVAFASFLAFGGFTIVSNTHLTSEALTTEAQSIVAATARAAVLEEHASTAIISFTTSHAVLFSKAQRVITAETSLLLM